ncbi:MAG: glycosyltransferase family 2 protein [Lachnospiraceae bacterium]|nr:glycosyltransferase family 2 protein [Lachnospiraceae bacterium]
MKHVSSDRRKCLVIIPAFNEAGAILNTVRDIEKNAPSFDYVVINDNSFDGTREILEENSINHVDLPINSGIGAAVQTGYLYASRYGYTAAIQVDGDGQHDAAFLEEMASALYESDAGMVIGSRFIEKDGFQSTGLRRVGIRFFTGLIKLLTGAKVTDPTSGMRIVGKDIIDIFAFDYPKDYPEPETAVVILKKGYKIKEIPVKMKKRETGKSSISPIRSIYYMVKVPLACILAAWG